MTSQQTEDWQLFFSQLDLDHCWGENRRVTKIKPYASYAVSFRKMVPPEDHPLDYLENSWRRRTQQPISPVEYISNAMTCRESARTFHADPTSLRLIHGSLDLIFHVTTLAYPLPDGILASMWWQNRISMKEVCRLVGSLTPAELSNPSLNIGICTAWDHNPG